MLLLVARSSSMWLRTTIAVSPAPSARQFVALQTNFCRNLICAFSAPIFCLAGCESFCKMNGLLFFLPFFCVVFGELGRDFLSAKCFLTPHTYFQKSLVPHCFDVLLFSFVALLIHISGGEEEKSKLGMGGQIFWGCKKTEQGDENGE